MHGRAGQRRMGPGDQLRSVCPLLPCVRFCRLSQRISGVHSATFLRWRPATRTACVSRAASCARCAANTARNATSALFHLKSLGLGLMWLAPWSGASSRWTTTASGWTTASGTATTALSSSLSRESGFNLFWPQNGLTLSLVGDPRSTTWVALLYLYNIWEIVARDGLTSALPCFFLGPCRNGMT